MEVLAGSRSADGDGVVGQRDGAVGQGTAGERREVAEGDRARCQEVSGQHGRRAGSDRPLDLETQLLWLREIGFADVDCYWKWLELALLGGAKQNPG